MWLLVSCHTYGCIYCWPSTSRVIGQAHCYKHFLLVEDLANCLARYKANLSIWSCFQKFSVSVDGYRCLVPVLSQLEFTFIQNHVEANFDSIHE